MKVLEEIKKANAIGIYLFAFLIPLNPKWLGFGILIIVLEQLFRRNFASLVNFKQLFNRKNAGLWLLLLYLMHFVGLLYTENTSFAWMDIGVKASFGIFPIVFVLFNFKIDLNTFFKSFIIGALVGALVCFYLSYLNYAATGETNHFSESNLSHFMHRSYWASYLVLAFVFSVFLVVKKQLSLILGGVLALIFFALVFISGSKAGILILVVATVALLIYIAKAAGQLRWALGLGILALLMLVVTLIAFPSVTKRIQSSYMYATGQYSIDVNNTESTAARMLMWKTSLELIKEKPFLGVGTGDVKDALVQRNTQNGYIDVAQRNMNAHNQFLNVWVSLGIFGAAFLICFFLFPFIYPPTDQSFIFRLIIFILFSSLLAESFLETQAGIIPVSFLMCMLTQVKSSNEIKS
jgi:O-antigen ligase